jgi:hypothetical protein
MTTGSEDSFSIDQDDERNVRRRINFTTPVRPSEPVVDV